MARKVSLLALGTVLAMGAGACASAGAGGSQPGEGPGGTQYQVLVTDFQAQGVEADQGASLAETVRGQINRIPMHEAVTGKVLDAAKQRYGLATLDSVSASQLAQQIGAELVVWGTVSQASDGLEASGRMFDVRNSDHYTLAPVTGANAKAAGQALAAEIQQTVGGIALAISCDEARTAQQYDVAIARCDSALAVSPQNGRALGAKAATLAAQQNYAQAVDVYAQLVEARPEDADAALAAGLAALQAKDAQHATEFFEHYRDLNQGDAAALTKAAGQIAQAGDYADAFAVVQPAIATQQGDPTFDHFIFSLGTAAGAAAAQTGGAEAATPYYTAALNSYKSLIASDTVQLELKDVEQAIAMSNGLGNTQEALQLAKDATVKYDTVAAIWALYGQSLSTAGQYPEAAQALTRLIQIDPTFENAYLLRGLAYSQMEGQQDAAVADLQQAASRGNAEKVGSVLYSMGAAALKAEDYEQAAATLEMAQGYAGADQKSDVSYYLGFSLYKQGEALVNADGSKSDALADFQKALTAVNASSNANAPQLATAIQQYIDYLNQ